MAAVAALASLRWLATYVDPETFGRYALYQSVVAAGALFLVSWPNAALLRFGREEWTHHGRVGVTLGARALLFAVTTSLALAVAWVLDPQLRVFLNVDQSPFIWVALGVIVLPAAELAVYANQAIGRTEIYGYSPLITRVGFLAGTALIPFLEGRPGWTYLACWLIGATAAAGAFAFTTMPRAAFSGFSVNSPTVIALLRYSWTLPFAAISTYIVNWIDSWVIRDVLGVGSVGVYNWAYQTTAIASLAFAPLAVVLTPRVIDARLRNDLTKIKRYVDAILPTATAMAIVVVVVLMMAFPLFSALVAPSYAPAYIVILILLSALPFQLIAYLVTPLANAYERLLPRIVLVSACIAAINAGADLVLVPYLGIAGAAIATTGAFTTGGLLLITVIRAEGIEFAPLWHYTIPAFIVLPSVAALYFLGPLRGAATIGAVCLFPLGGATYWSMRSRRAALGATSLSIVRSTARALALSDNKVPSPLS
jgi:O-antigen/teichoic acid export membrane protein